MLEANDAALLNVLSEAIDRLTNIRDDLRDRGSVEILVDDGHRARLAYEAMSSRPLCRSPASPSVPGMAAGTTPPGAHGPGLGGLMSAGFGWVGVYTRSDSPS